MFPLFALFWKGEIFLCVVSFFLFFIENLCLLILTLPFYLFTVSTPKRPSHHFPFWNVFFASLFFPRVLPKCTCSLFCLSVFSRCFLLAALLKFLFSLSFAVSLFSQSKTFSQNFCFVSLYTSAKLSFSVFFFFTLKIMLSVSFLLDIFFTFVCPCFVFFRVLRKSFSFFLWLSFPVFFFHFFGVNKFSFFTLLLWYIQKDFGFSKKNWGDIFFLFSFGFFFSSFSLLLWFLQSFCVWNNPFYFEPFFWNFFLKPFLVIFHHFSLWSLFLSSFCPSHGAFVKFFFLSFHHYFFISLSPCFPFFFSISCFLYLFSRMCFLKSFLKWFFDLLRNFFLFFCFE